MTLVDVKMRARLQVAATVMVLGIVEASPQNNVFGQQLEVCSQQPLTGWYRDGYCRTDDNDHGSHTVGSNI